MSESIKVGGINQINQAVKSALPEQAKSVEADMDALLLGGVLERDVEPFPGWKVTMHTLTSDERVEAAKHIPSELMMNANASQEALKLPTLVQAISKLDIKGVVRHFKTPEDRAALQTILSSASAIVVDVLYMEYFKLVNDLIVIIETGVKKN